MSDFLDSMTATVIALHLPYEPRWTPITSILGLYAVLAAVLAAGHVAAASLGDRQWAAARITAARNAIIFSVIVFGLALVAAGLPLGRFL